MAPAGMLSKKAGRLVAVCIRATSRAEVVSVVTSHTPATFCIQVPTLLTTEASQMARKTWYANGARSPGRGSAGIEGVGLIY